MTDFNTLGLSSPIMKALAAASYELPTPIQSRAIPILLAGSDLLGIAQTGTGKTAAFTLPILDRLARLQTRARPGTCHALILSPTRELCAQIGKAIQGYGRFLPFRVATIYGGVSIGKQISTLRSGVDIIVATPGRLIDVIERRALSLSAVKVFVLDEADHMLDLGFVQSIRQIARLLPKERQSMFFSATMPKDIASLANDLLRKPVRIEATPPATTVDRVDQRVIHTAPGQKLPVLVQLLTANDVNRCIVFTRTKRGADKLTRGLTGAGIGAAAIHGNKSQPQRERTLALFRSGQTKVLVATDIAARGIDVEGISHVVNYELPDVAEAYVHRIGRTARAGAGGVAISFCEPEQRPLLQAIERLIKARIRPGAQMDRPGPRQAMPNPGMKRQPSAADRPWAS